MLAELPRVLAQLSDRRFIAVFLKSVALTLFILGGVWYGFDSWLSGISAPPMPLWMQRYWADAADWAALPVVIIAGWFLFPGIATGVMGLFLDDVVLERSMKRRLQETRSRNKVHIRTDGLLFQRLGTGLCLLYKEGYVHP